MKGAYRRAYREKIDRIKNLMALYDMYKLKVDEFCSQRGGEDCSTRLSRKIFSIIYDKIVRGEEVGSIDLEKLYRELGKESSNGLSESGGDFGSAENYAESSKERSQNKV